jgi:hypothetical protein
VFCCCKSRLDRSESFLQGPVRIVKFRNKRLNLTKRRLGRKTLEQWLSIHDRTRDCVFRSLETEMKNRSHCRDSTKSSGQMPEYKQWSLTWLFTFAAGIWTRDLKLRSNLQQPQITKIIKTLEGRRLIKAVKSVAVSSWPPLRSARHLNGYFDLLASVSSSPYICKPRAMKRTFQACM